VALALVWLLLGTIVLAVGSETAVRGAAATSRLLRVSPFVLGAVLFGIDVESLGAALIAAGRDETSIAAGSAFGTIVFVFSAAFGAALLVSRRPVEAPSPAMVLLPAATFLAGGLAITDQFVGRFEGIALVSVYLLYLSQVLREARPPDVDDRDARSGGASRARSFLLMTMGLLLLYTGASVLVIAGARLVERTALPAGFVGAAVLGALASADEVFLEILPIRRGMPSLAVGNLFGTAAAFSSLVIGLAALVRPLALDSGATTAFLAAATLYAFVAATFLLRGRAGRWLGLGVLMAYASWLVLATNF
jgi:cation:H+ antiporter